MTSPPPPPLISHGGSRSLSHDVLVVSRKPSSSSASPPRHPTPSKRKRLVLSDDDDDEAAQADLAKDSFNAAATSNSSRLQTLLHFEPVDVSRLRRLRRLVEIEEDRSDDEDEVDPFEGDYERRRRKRLRANQALFEELGLGDDVHFASIPRPRAPPRSTWLSFDYIDLPGLPSHIKEQYQLRLHVSAKPLVVSPVDRWHLCRQIAELEAHLQVIRYNLHFDLLHQRSRQSDSANSECSANSSSSASPVSSTYSVYAPTSQASDPRRLIVRLRRPAESTTGYSSTRSSSKEPNVWVRSAADVSDRSSEELDWMRERQNDADDEEQKAAQSAASDNDDFASGAIEYPPQKSSMTPEAERVLDDRQTYSMTPQASEHTQETTYSWSPEADKVRSSSTHSWSATNRSSPLPHHHTQRLDPNGNPTLHVSNPAYSSLTASTALTPPSVPYSSQRHSPSSSQTSYRASPYDHSASPAASHYHSTQLHSHAASHHLPHPHSRSGTPDMDEFFSTDPSAA